MAAMLGKVEFFSVEGFHDQGRDLGFGVDLGRGVGVGVGVGQGVPIPSHQVM